MEETVKHVSKFAEQEINQALRDAKRISIFHCEKCGGNVEILIGATIAYSVQVSRGLKVVGEATLITDDALTDWILRCQKCAHEPQDLPLWLCEEISRNIGYQTVSQRLTTERRLKGEN